MGAFLFSWPFWAINLNHKGMVMLMVHTTFEEHMGYGMLNAPYPHTPSLFQMKKTKNTEINYNKMLRCYLLL